MPKERVCANGRALSRRSLMTGLPLAGALASIPSTGATSTDPVIPHYRDWCRANSEWLRLSYLPGNEDWEWPESLAAEAREEAALRSILAHTPTTLEGIAACTHAAWSFIGPASAPWSPDFQDELELPQLQLLAAIWRAAGGEGQYPNQ